MKAALQQFIRNEDGVTMIEYGLLAALVAVAAIAGLTTLGGKLTDTFNQVAGKLIVP